jgi:hypothetical protein
MLLFVPACVASLAGRAWSEEKNRKGKGRKKKRKGKTKKEREIKKENRKKDKIDYLTF